ncbi:MAG TPA: hypothetical protein VLL98_00420 [Rickettsiales bacterium]|nr:hypothetical protein [Rickettsiales bacterium]
MKRLYIIIIFLLFVNNLVYANELTIDINNIESKKISIVFEKINKIDIKNFDFDIVDKILKNIKNNLYTTSLFNIKNSNSNIFKSDNNNNIEKLSSIDLNSLVMSKYNKSSFDAVMSGFLEVNSSGQVELKIRLWDILDQRELFYKSYIIDETNWKKISDIISDMVFEFLTGEVSGHFDSKIIFVSESGSPKNRQKRIAMMDFDGSNLQYITNGTNLVLTPIFSKYNKDEIIYLEYKNKKPHIFKLNLSNKKLILIGNIAEMTFAPNFNPSGLNEIIFSGTNDGYSNIYKLNFDEGKIRQLTYDKAISTAPSWSPDAEKIVFVSDKTGVRKLYVMDKNGSNIEMISKGRGIYDKPSWSPDGKLISFVKMEKGEFSIGLMTPDGDSERSIMNAYLVEGIKWSPNGRYLIYSKQEGPFGKASIPSIYTIDILTGIEYKIPTPKNQGATDPDWIIK